MHSRIRFIPAALALAGSLVLGGLAAALTESAATTGIEFTDAKKQTEEFIGYYKSIELTPEQEAIKKEALTAIPAPCCSNNTAYTCCCPCNMAKSYWGLAAYLITEQGADAAAVQGAVNEWIAFINPEGFSGDVCYSAGGCMRAFKQNGCGGMRETQVTF
jgi:hypothetical protein